MVSRLHVGTGIGGYESYHGTFHHD